MVVGEALHVGAVAGRVSNEEDVAGVVVRVGLAPVETGLVTAVDPCGLKPLGTSLVGVGGPDGVRRVAVHRELHRLTGVAVDRGSGQPSLLEGPDRPQRAVLVGVGDAVGRKTAGSGVRHTADQAGGRVVLPRLVGAGECPFCSRDDGAAIDTLGNALSSPQRCTDEPSAPMAVL